MKGFHSVLEWAHGRLLSLDIQSHGSVVTHERKPLHALYNSFSMFFSYGTT